MSAQPSKGGFVDVPGARLAYEVAGEGEALLLIHGGLADRTMWDDQLGAFSERYRTIRFDMRGFGESTMSPGPFALHEDVRAVLAALGETQAHVLGLSLGGRVAIDFALTYPEMVRTLILAGSALGGYTFSESTMRQIDEADEALDAGDIPRGVELELRLWIDGPRRTPDQVDPAVRERVRAMNTRNYERASPEGEPQWPEPPAVSRLAEIEIPTLVIVGGGDVDDIHRIADLLVAEIPRSTKVVIPDAAHHPNMEKPEEFNRAVLNFLAEHTAHRTS